MAEHLSLLVLNIWQTSHSAFLLNGPELLLFAGGWGHGCRLGEGRTNGMIIELRIKFFIFLQNERGCRNESSRAIQDCAVHVEDKQALVPDAPRWQFY